MNLSRFTERLAGDLSGGMKQKLGLACTLIRKPTLLLLDEPSVGVDPVSRRELWELMQQFLKEGITIIWSTSYLDEAEKADLVLLLHEGKLLYQGAPQDLTARVQGKTFTLEKALERKRVLLSQSTQSAIHFRWDYPRRQNTNRHKKCRAGRPFMDAMSSSF